MLQTGALIRDLSVRELIELTASLYPQPLDVGEVLRAFRNRRAGRADRRARTAVGQHRVARRGAWTVVLTAAARRAYQRDTARV